MKNKIIHGAIPALLIHLSIGSVYAWSVFVNPISEILKLNLSSIQFAFSLAIFFLGMSAAFLGNLVEKNIKISSFLSIIFFCIGLVISGLAIHIKSLILLYLGYGVLMGIGVGIGYLTPCKTLMLWFKDNKGLAIGLSVMGFGFASTIAGPMITAFIKWVGVSMAFYLLAIIYCIPMVIAMILIKKPDGEEQKDIARTGFKYRKMFTNKTFIILWIMFFINIHCGLSIISSASPIMQEFGATVLFATTAVSIMGIFNGIGRIGLATISDGFEHRLSIGFIIFISSIIAMVVLSNSHDMWWIMLSLCTITAMYGAGFSTIAPILSDKFGMDNISKIHGLILSAWGIAGLTGNQMTAIIYNLTNSYRPVIYINLFLYNVALILVAILYYYDAVKESKKNN